MILKKKTLLFVVIGVALVCAVGWYFALSAGLMSGTSGLFGEEVVTLSGGGTPVEGLEDIISDPEGVMSNEQSTSTDDGQMVDTSSANDTAESSGNREQAGPVMTSTRQTANTEARATIMVAGGCFWCVEADLEKLQGVLEAVSGYAGGTSENPTYSDYSKSGHREVVLATYNPTVVSFREIVIYALKHMDPTDADGSFYDRGRQYAPAFYYRTDEEKRIIEDVIAKVDALKVYEKPIVANVFPEPTFWHAEDYHQDYYKGTFSSLKYKYYRNASGRDDFIKTHWGDNTGPTLPTDAQPYDFSRWENFQKPPNEALRTQLTDEQYKITQKDGTEPAFNNEYWDNKEEGIYVDVVSGEPLYSSTDKFDSGTGWPSFTKPIYSGAVTEHADYKLVLPRTEVRSRFADSHLGHVFKDAPPELGGIRHCINSAALRFVPKDRMEAEGYGQFLSLLE